MRAEPSGKPCLEYGRLLDRAHASNVDNPIPGFGTFIGKLKTSLARLEQGCILPPRAGDCGTPDTLAPTRKDRLPESL